VFEECWVWFDVRFLGLDMSECAINLALGHSCEGSSGDRTTSRTAYRTVHEYGLAGVKQPPQSVDRLSKVLEVALRAINERVSGNSHVIGVRSVGLAVGQLDSGGDSVPPEHLGVSSSVEATDVEPRGDLFHATTHEQFNPNMGFLCAVTAYQLNRH
jgi:hypothetical protein